MKRVSRTGAFVALLLGVAFVAQSHAQSSGGPFVIEPVAIAGGGSPIGGGQFLITSTLGQAATSTLSGAGFVIVDGFWSPVGGLTGDVIFANGFDSN